MLEKIQRIKLSEEILHRLKDMIKGGKFVYGDKLPVEKRLAEIFGVSRTTVREALAVLEAEGWVTTKRGGGTFVKRVRIQDPVQPLTALLGGENVAILEVIELRKILEGEVALLAASRATTEDIATLKQAYRNMAEAISLGNATADSDYDFHYSIAKATQNNTILKVVSALHDLYHEVVRTTSSHWSKPHDYDRVLKEHDAILRAIEKHQGPAAKKQMLTHLESIHRVVEEVLMKKNDDPNGAIEPE